ncbi:hypothetical protein PUW24_08010 [Paenibacillus urinalis]|uniref:Uncharacterized protein n=1 Tax=Paenibacillus urinalis TaxID=521520 RepID=A0AAX3MYT3_9BACL|nr:MULTISPECIES: hypothetical protein [Paenibacillus]WDH82795.1 hypothetical protein PUW23_00470 [Paenibacillus urinalis]WDH98843.1 hypothetical protein PUW24_08010 [Paenibacillus urinalis]WDI02539.1 hypothetical protein PUW25_00470 [Paenibacillus urinalis]
MGVKHGREYSDILEDLIKAIGKIPDRYTFFEMEEEDWERLGAADRREVDEALAEDLFYALGGESMITVGSGVVIHDKENHRLNILIGEDELDFVALI